MKRIWKYDVPIENGDIVRSMPAHAAILTVQMQGDSPKLWAMVDPQPTGYEDRTFRWYGTGHNMPDYPGEYRGTVQMYDGSLVFHIFETFGVTEERR